jgi:hypothetical protein
MHPLIEEREQLTGLSVSHKDRKPHFMLGTGFDWPCSYGSNKCALVIYAVCLDLGPRPNLLGRGLNRLFGAGIGFGRGRLRMNEQCKDCEGNSK